MVQQRGVVRRTSSFLTWSTPCAILKRLVRWRESRTRRVVGRPPARLSRHFPYGLSRETLQARNGSHFNIAPPPCRAHGKFLPVFRLRIRPKTRPGCQPERFPASISGSAQTFSVGNLVFHSLIRSRVTSCDQRRRRQPRNAVEDRGEQVSRHGHFSQLKRHILRVPSDLSSDLDQLLPQRRQ